MCEFQYYKKEEKYYPKLYCNINDNRCPYSKRCNIEEKWLPLPSQKNCGVREMELKRNIPNDAYAVRFEKGGFLYVDVENHTMKFKNTIGKIPNGYVYIKEDKISLEPFKEEKKKEKKKDKKNTFESVDEL